MTTIFNYSITSLKVIQGKMENQFRHESGTTDDDSCGCSCHPGSEAGGCSGCAPVHGSGKIGSMDPFEMVIPMWHKGFFCSIFGVDD
ncbi:MAG: hypothetical protein WAM14_09125 [Candidatus Nitrosopolaris sp.]